MASGFRRDDNDVWQSKCPKCGRFVDPEDAFYCREYATDENVAAFCSDKHAEAYPKKDTQ